MSVLYWIDKSQEYWYGVKSRGINIILIFLNYSIWNEVAWASGNDDGVEK